LQTDHKGCLLTQTEAVALKTGKMTQNTYKYSTNAIIFHQNFAGFKN
jgi:hypothetical protein